MTTLFPSKIRLIGVSINMKIAIVFIAVGFLMCYLTVCNCTHNSGSLLEGMAPMDYTMGSDVASSLHNKKVKQAGAVGGDIMTESGLNMDGTPSPYDLLEQGEMFMLRDNKFSPECCPSSYSNSMGCACMSKKQNDALNQRGGNRTQPSIF